jgi:hypothetical protein
VAALLQWHLERGLRSLGMVDRGGVAGSIDSPPAHPSTASLGVELANGSAVGAP